MMKYEQLIRGQRDLGVSRAIIVREFDFVSAVQRLDHSTHLSSQESLSRHIREKGHDVQ